MITLPLGRTEAVSGWTDSGAAVVVVVVVDGGTVVVVDGGTVVVVDGGTVVVVDGGTVVVVDGGTVVVVDGGVVVVVVGGGVSVVVDGELVGVVVVVVGAEGTEVVAEEDAEGVDGGSATASSCVVVVVSSEGIGVGASWTGFSGAGPPAAMIASTTSPLSPAPAITTSTTSRVGRSAGEGMTPVTREVVMIAELAASVTTSRPRAGSPLDQGNCPMAANGPVAHLSLPIATRINALATFGSN
jgi:hypothetical protein